MKIKTETKYDHEYCIKGSYPGQSLPRSFSAEPYI